MACVTSSRRRAVLVDPAARRSKRTTWSSRRASRRQAQVPEVGLTFTASRVRDAQIELTREGLRHRCFTSSLRSPVTGNSRWSDPARREGIERDPEHVRLRERATSGRAIGRVRELVDRELGSGVRYNVVDGGRTLVRATDQIEVDRFATLVCWA